MSNRLRRRVPRDQGSVRARPAAVRMGRCGVGGELGELAAGAAVVRALNGAVAAHWWAIRSTPQRATPSIPTHPKGGLGGPLRRVGCGARGSGTAQHGARRVEAGRARSLRRSISRPISVQRRPRSVRTRRHQAAVGSWGTRRSRPAASIRRCLVTSAWQARRPATRRGRRLGKGRRTYCWPRDAVPEGVASCGARALRPRTTGWSPGRSLTGAPSVRAHYH